MDIFLKPLAKLVILEMSLRSSSIDGGVCLGVWPSGSEFSDLIIVRPVERFGIARDSRGDSEIGMIPPYLLLLLLLPLGMIAMLLRPVCPLTRSKTLLASSSEALTTIILPLFVPCYRDVIRAVFHRITEEPMLSGDWYMVH